MFNKDIMKDSLVQSLKKLTPRVQIKNPVMFVVYLGAILTSVLFILSLFGISDAQSGYTPVSYTHLSAGGEPAAGPWLRAWPVHGVI